MYIKRKNRRKKMKKIYCIIIMNVFICTYMYIYKCDLKPINNNKKNKEMLKKC